MIAPIGRAPASGRRVGVALAVALRGAREPRQRLLASPVHQERQTRARGGVSHPGQLPLPVVGVLGRRQPRLAVLVAADLSRDVLGPHGAGTLAAMGLFKKKLDVPEAADALPGREEAIEVPDRHFVLGTQLVPPFPEGFESAVFGMGCFWGAERMFWQAPGVYTTAVGYAGGTTPNPTYREVCSGMTGHAEVVLAVFDPERDELRRDAAHLLGGSRPDPGHAPGKRRRNPVPVGDLCRVRRAARRGRALEGDVRRRRSPREGFGEITTEIRGAQTFYYAEDYHQQYLAKNPNGYCGIGGTGVSCPVGHRRAETAARTPSHQIQGTSRAFPCSYSR